MKNDAQIHSLSLSELVDDLQALERRVDALEQAQPMLQQTSTWVMGAVWAAAGFAGVLVAQKLGLL